MEDTKLSIMTGDRRWTSCDRKWVDFINSRIGTKAGSCRTYTTYKLYSRCKMHGNLDSKQ
jgi:hypothetical protein